MCNFRMSHFGGAVLLSAILAGSLHAEDDERPDWFLTQRNITAILMQPDANLAALANKVGESAPMDGHWAMYNLCVFARAGMYKESIRTLDHLKRFCPELDNYQLSSIYYHACERQAWDLAKATVEIFADNISELLLENRLLKYFADSGWQIERIDEWLASKPKGVKNYWVKERLRFNVQHGRGEALLNELLDKAKTNPHDRGEALALLDVMIHTRRDQADMPDLTWISETITPESATDAHEIASRLMTLQAWKSAIIFYRRAIATELTDKEIQQLEQGSYGPIPAARIRASFAASTREGLGECLLKTDRSAEAQKWILEASDIRKKHNLGSNALFAGQVQPASGEQVMEEQIKAEETASANEPEYWRKRARYYRGRNEPAQEEFALKRGLDPIETQPESQASTEEQMLGRLLLLSDYVHFLAREKREEEAVDLLREEMTSLPVNSESSRQVVQMLLASQFEKHVSPDDAVLWNWLENRTKWEYPGDRLLWRMLENGNRDDLDKHFTRAEKLAFNSDPSRAYAIGWIEHRMKFPKRSVPLLEYAIEKAQEDELKYTASLALIESYLETANWKRAEQILPNVAQRLPFTELPKWYSSIAVASATAGAKVDAMRIWSRVANLDLSATGAVKDLSDAGLTDELIDFYVEVQKTLPLSSIPPEVLKTLQE